MHPLVRWRRWVTFSLCLLLLRGTPAVELATQPLFSSVNAKYSLVVDFFGEWVGPDGDEKSQYLVDRMVLRDTRSSRSVEVQFAALAELRTSQAFFREVWSPDDEYLAVPSGRFEGFQIYNAPTLFDGFNAQAPTDTVSIRYRRQAKSVWHDFVGWKDDHVLRFATDIEGSKTDFLYDLKRKRLVSPATAIPLLDAVNRTGPLAIDWAR